MKKQPNTIVTQRFFRKVLSGLFLILTLMLLVIALVIAKQASDHALKYWYGYSEKFAKEAKYQLIMQSKSGLENIAKNYVDEKNVLSAQVFDVNNELLASSGSTYKCSQPEISFMSLLFPKATDTFCIQAQVRQTAKESSSAVENNELGNVLLTISKKELADLMKKIWFALIIIMIVFSISAFYVVRTQSMLLMTTLDQMIEGLKNCRNNKSNNRVTFAGTEELDLMRETFNELLTSIERHEELLEQAVIVKTQELKIALEGSKSANLYKTKIMSTVSHEMKNPLHSILGSVQLLFEALPKNSEKYDTLNDHYKIAVAQVHVLDDYIESILLNAQLESSSYKVNYSLVNLNNLVHESQQKTVALRNKNGNQLTVSGDKNIEIYTDQKLLRQIVDNLLSNASKFTTGGQIQLKWYKQDTNLIIEVEDTGCGMSESEIVKIFDAFMQIDMSMSRKYGGFGLGLAIARQSAQLLNGDIVVKSAIGKGSTFKVFLPIDQTPYIHHP